MAKLAYYIFIIPLSILPLWVLYLITDLLFLLLITIIPYRRSVIEKNISNSFPELSKSEQKKIKRKFYRHFTDLLAEGVKSLTFSKKFISKHIKVVNPDVMNELYNQGKNVILVSGHYNNWEWIVHTQSLLFKHKAIGIGMPLTSKFWDKKINQRRSRYGMTVAHSKNYKEVINSFKNDLKAILVLSDQSPGDTNKSYWMDFLNQKTAVAFGAELMAHQLDYAVVFYAQRKTKRGYYEIELTEIAKEPKKTEWGFITESHVKLLQDEIIQQPQYWLWSHKRWKRDHPSDFNELKQIQRNKFYEKFNY